MDIIVIGAGVVGISCAWRLVQDGHRVSVIDSAKAVGNGASFSNGGQLSYSYVAPLADPSVWGQLPKLLTDPASPVQFRPGFDPFQYRWLMQFLAACTPERARRTIDLLGSLAERSKRILHDSASLREIDFNWTQTGKLVVYSSEKSYSAARRYAEQQAQSGTDKRAVPVAECLALEPALAAIADRLVGGLFSPGDEAGDAHLFTKGMAGLLGENALMLDTEVRGFVREGRTIKAVRTGRGDFEADIFVLAAGVASRALGQSAGLDLPIYPLKGYSATAPIPAAAPAPSVSITDAARKVVYARLGATLRLAGAADLVGHDLGIDQRRIGQLLSDARHDFPDAADWQNALLWAGQRPATPTGLPILGRSRSAENLLLNVGHGALGFTLALGSAERIADELAGRRVPAGFAL
ncbi:D-amino acid dehydrogenase [Devosia chinhatensis]|uniref:FAD dependent oxidoreductase domain-containing protein n=1 Tax=Devosia chinhatensis TaxID=429727 RepID=A0A0F5FFH0_9HYPH|nr:D-amino acid dehydrogenase [Devosia chinhatensis]KKB07639.1 hypothetical protein VE26_13160 [Devosia chinhatensis]